MTGCPRPATGAARMEKSSRHSASGFIISDELTLLPRLDRTAVFCCVPDCNSEKEFESHEGLDMHLRAAHKLYGEENAKYLPIASTFPKSKKLTSRVCPVGGSIECDEVYKHQRELVNHLKRQHKLSKEEAQAKIDP